MRRRGRVAAFVRGVAHAKGRAYAHSAAPQTAVRSCSQPCTAIHNRWGGGESMRPADERPWLAEGTPPLPPPLASLPKASLLGGPCRVAPNCGCDPKPSETGCAHACGDACAHACGGGPKPAPSDGGGCGNAAATDGGIKAVTLGSLEATTNSNICESTSLEMDGRKRSRWSNASFSCAKPFCTCLSWCTPSMRARTGATTRGITEP
mmetsp:Transcript_59879/g.129799  ORF Transcript_59879/g.129799 Transcript_59879/m.129799 type:complete len:207 (-) Transcript_59879:514-1134(-)